MPPLLSPSVPGAFRRATHNLVFRWTAGAVALPGFVAIGGAAILAPALLPPAATMGAMGGWLVCAAALGWGTARVLAPTLSRPAAWRCARRAEVPVPHGERSMARSP